MPIPVLTSNIAFACASVRALQVSLMPNPSIVCFV